MVNIDTNVPKPLIPVTRTRKTAQTHGVAIPQQSSARTTESKVERRKKKERRSDRKKTLLDLRSGRDRRNARLGRAIDITV